MAVPSPGHRVEQGRGSECGENGDRPVSRQLPDQVAISAAEQSPSGWEKTKRAGPFGPARSCAFRVNRWTDQAALMALSLRILSSIGGWVEKSLSMALPDRGFTM